MNLGGSEILVIIFVALMIFGPDKLPTALRTFGRIMGEVRKYQDMAKSEIENAVATATSQPSSDSVEPTEVIPDKNKTKAEKRTEPNDDVVRPIVDEDEQ